MSFLNREVYGASFIGRQVDNFNNFNQILIDGMPIDKWLIQQNQDIIDISKFVFYIQGSVELSSKYSDDKNEMVYRDGRYTIYYDNKCITQQFVGTTLQIDTNDFYIFINEIKKPYTLKLNSDLFTKNDIEQAYLGCLNDIEDKIKQLEDQLEYQKYEHDQAQYERNFNKINRIAKKIISSQIKNDLDKYFIFYNDGKWVVEIVRQLNSILIKLSKSINNYNQFIPKLDEYINYLQEVKCNEMNTSSSVKEIKDFQKQIKDIYKKYDKSSLADQRASLNEDYNEVLKKFKDFVIAYEKSCINIYKNKYVEDQENVRNLLDTIHENGNYVINKNSGE